MAVNDQAVGKRYPAVDYVVGREKIREYARAVGETDPVHHDLAAARAAGHRDLVAPPMFAVVYTSAAIAAPLSDPEVGIDFAMLVHGEQEFRWGLLVIAGDEISTTTVVAQIRARTGLGYYVFETTSLRQDGETVCSGTWTMIVREAS